CCGSCLLRTEPVLVLDMYVKRNERQIFECPDIVGAARFRCQEQGYPGCRASTCKGPFGTVMHAKTLQRACCAEGRDGAFQACRRALLCTAQALPTRARAAADAGLPEARLEHFLFSMARARRK